MCSPRCGGHAVNIHFSYLHCTLKRTDENGNVIYEGTNDVGTEPDIVLYLVADKLEDKTIISTQAEKTRAMEFRPLSWELKWVEGQPIIRSIDHVDLTKIQEARENHTKDRDGIASIQHAIRVGCHTRRGIEDFCSDRGLSNRQTGRILKTYQRGHRVQGIPSYWSVTRAKKNNADYYSLMPTVITPAPPAHSGDSDNSGDSGDSAANL